MKKIRLDTPMKKMLAYVGIFFFIIFGWYGAKKLFIFWMMSHYQPPPATVTATQVVSKPWHAYLTAVGTLQAINGVDLAAETSGIVQEIRFNSGQFVHKGDVVIKLKADIEQAAVKSSQAKFSLAKMNYEREKTLLDRRVISQASLDASFAELQQAEAQLETAKAQLQQKIITAPFDGRIGIKQVNLGQYLSPGTTLVTLQALNALYVSFSLPEQYLNQLYINQPVEVAVNFGSGKIVRGRITAINSKIDAATRNVSIQATIPNDGYVLYPGMYGQVKVELPVKKNTLVIPTTAISYSLEGNFVFVIKDNKVHKQSVKIGEQRDNVATIIDGLSINDKIVTSGQLKLHNNAQVVIDNKVVM